MKSIIKVQNLVKTYRVGEVETKALRGVTFEIGSGEFAAIMGPSGSGKSTLLHILGCLDTPTSGSYYFEDQDVSKLDEDALAEIRNKKVGFVFQAFNLLPRLTLLKNVMLPLMYTKIKDREKIAKKALESVGLGHKLQSRPNQISGGEVERGAIARALVLNPSIILADEPTGNLDSKTAKEIMAIFQKLNQQGHTIIVITHEPFIAKHTKRVIQIKDGLVISDLPNGERVFAK